MPKVCGFVSCILFLSSHAPTVLRTALTAEKVWVLRTALDFSALFSLACEPFIFYISCFVLLFLATAYINWVSPAPSLRSYPSSFATPI
ncbi:hypothetical protein RchiOBHm_Chr6g0259891 [Rosa chinensis]|uniref:Uncharacterized protein n=1 Tax=Rosa chinensis TaxID=74649 RepID=A0A2P6PMZ5_ROSCH|nr:hypothetical protein RchiOBHm_Chr6g0259891 [Rosa chinensis]